jgi:hypothetical protein
LILNILVVEEDIKGYDGPQIKEIIDGKMDLEIRQKGESSHVRNDLPAPA